MNRLDGKIALISGAKPASWHAQISAPGNPQWSLMPSGGWH